MKKLLVLAVFLSAAALTNAGYLVMDSQGFEGYNLGTINNQNAGYWNPGCTGQKKWVQIGGDPEFDVFGQVVTLDQQHGKVLKFNDVGADWLAKLRCDLKFLGNSSGYSQYYGQAQVVEVEFDAFINYSGTDLVDGAVRTYRNSYATLESEYWFGAKVNDVSKVKAYMSLSPSTGAVTSVICDFALGQWHHIKFTQYGLNNVRQESKIFVDGLQLGTYYTVWGSYAGYMSNVDFCYNITDAGTMYVDNFKVNYMPEPTTMAILGIGLAFLRRRIA